MHQLNGNTVNDISIRLNVSNCICYYPWLDIQDIINTEILFGRKNQFTKLSDEWQNKQQHIAISHFARNRRTVTTISAVSLWLNFFNNIIHMYDGNMMEIYNYQNQMYSFLFSKRIFNIIEYLIHSNNYNIETSSYSIDKNITLKVK